MTLPNSFGKLFNIILYNRLSNKLQNTKHKLDFVRTMKRQMMSSLFSALQKIMSQITNIYIPAFLTFRKCTIQFGARGER